MGPSRHWAQPARQKQQPEPLGQQLLAPTHWAAGTAPKQRAQHPQAAAVAPTSSGSGHSTHKQRPQAVCTAPTCTTLSFATRPLALRSAAAAAAGPAPESSSQRGDSGSPAMPAPAAGVGANKRRGETRSNLQTGGSQESWSGLPATAAGRPAVSPSFPRALPAWLAAVQLRPGLTYSTRRGSQTHQAPLNSPPLPCPPGRPHTYPQLVGLRGLQPAHTSSASPPLAPQKRTRQRNCRQGRRRRQSDFRQGRQRRRLNCWQGRRRRLCECM